MTQTEQRKNTGKWMALIAALLGWMFDGAEMGLFSMVGRSAVQNLLNYPEKLPDTIPAEEQKTIKAEQEKQISFYFGVVIALFLVGAATGGVLFGWLGDRIGRVRAMSLSVITYAVFTGLCGLADSAWQVALLRFIAALGMGGEWSLGVALVMEVWPNRSRALMAGLIGAAANVGYLLVGVVGLGLNAVINELADVLRTVGFSETMVSSLIAYKGWRLMMLFGTFPALLTFLIRIFVPESEKWEQEKGTGSTSHWATQDLLGVLVGATGPGLIIVVWSLGWPQSWGGATILLLQLAGSVLGIVIATLGYLYPVRRYLSRIAAQPGARPIDGDKTIRRMLLAAGLSGVALMGTWGSTQWAAAWASKLDSSPGVREWTQIWLSIGACLGTVGAALMGDWLGRRVTYFLMCVTSLVSALIFFQANTVYGNHFLLWAFIAGTCTASFYGWLPLYLPELFGTQVRATGQGFGFNFGRILAAVGSLNTGLMTGMFLKEEHFLFLTFRPGYPGACSAMTAIYLVGMILIWFAPETKGQPLPD